jgi:hypothetical protein
MLAMAEYTVEVPSVVARTLVPTHLMLDVQLGVLAVLLGLIMLLAIFDQPPATVVSGPLAIQRDLFLARRPRLALMELLHQPVMSLISVLALGVCLRPLLLVVVLPIPHVDPPLS